MPTTTAAAETMPNTIRVKLVKQRHGGLGFLVKQRTEKPLVVVADLVAGGIAEESGLVQVGDIILRLNDINLADMSYESAVEVLKAVPTDAPVVMLLRGPEGYTTHLETTFLENGLPKTVRVTKPIQDSLMGRIRRTFSSNGSPCQFKALKKMYKKGEEVGEEGAEDGSSGGGGKVNGSTPVGGGGGEDNVVELIDADAMDPSTRAAAIADSGYASSALSDSNGGGGGGGGGGGVVTVPRQKVLDNGSMGSPKIVLTAPRNLNGPPQDGGVPQAVNGGGGGGGGGGARRPSSGSRRAIEIVQDNDEITVVVKGDVRIHSDMGMATSSKASDPDTPKRFVISSNTSAPPAHAAAASPHPDPPGEKSNGHLQPQDKGSPEHKGGSTDWGGDLSDSEERGGGAQQQQLSANARRRSSPTSPRKGSSPGPEGRRGSMATPKKFAKLRHLLDERTTVDVLHQKVTATLTCTPERCMGSLMNTIVKTGPARKKEEMQSHAKEFLEQYYSSIKRLNTAAYQKRVQEVQACIERSGTYELTTAELIYGAKTGWRNAPRCIGRIQWSKLQVFDARHINTARGMYEALCNHIKYGTNKGNLRSAITIFPQRVTGRGDFRVWNAQLIMYAGYRQPDGSVIGDPKSVEFTEVVMKMGWKPKGTPFDLLPLVLSAAGQDPEMFDIPPELILEVPLKHPKYPWFGEMGIKWYALPAVSGMLFDCGGLEFTACPFNGWYMGTEIGARDLCDSNRYNILEKVATSMGLDTRKSSSLWKDRALVEVNIAVLHSYQASGVTITDHHAASDSFMKHMENEQRLRGGCPADWVWVVPPMSGSITPVFHQEMLLYKLRPSYEYQEEPWKTHVWKKDRDKPKNLERSKRKFGFRELARAVKFSAKLMGRALARRVKCTILYATETGKSERFANTLCEIFKHAFDAKVVCMDSYDVISLEHESLVLVVTSTFGNGDPPENGEVMAKALYEMKHPETTGSANFSSSSYIRMSVSSDRGSRTDDKETNEDDNLTMETGPLGNVRYSVFALGSRAYPHFASFGHYMDTILNELGAECIQKIGEGDELCGQEQSFRTWAEAVFTAACETFCLGDDVNISEATGALSNTDHSWTPNRFRLTPLPEGTKGADVCRALGRLHGKTVLPCRLTERLQLQSADSTRQTILVKLNTQDSSELQYAPGDHVGIFPAHPPDLVDAILARLHNAPPPDQVVRTEFLQETSTALGSSKNWTAYEKMPECSMRTALTHFLDVSAPPSQAFLQLLATQASRDQDRQRLELLAKDSKAYEDWRYDLYPNLLEVLDQFPSLKVPPSLLMTQLPLLQQRFYSISSSPMECVGEIHATVAVVKYRTQNGTGPLHEGVCSGWLNRCDLGAIIPCAVRAAPVFRLPEDQTLDVIMVGPGTGIAPFRSFWQQRKVDREMKTVPTHGEKRGWGEMRLYFGCRQRSVDNIYGEELNQMKADNVLTETYLALSREPGQPKVYVQDILFRNAKSTYEAVVKRGGHFYVCGDVSMANDVTKTLEQILMQHGGMEAEQAKHFVLKLKNANRFHEDIFGVNIQRTTEAGDKSRDQGQRAWQFIDSPAKPAYKEQAQPMPLPDKRVSMSKPRVPMKNVFMKQRVAPGNPASSPTSSPTSSPSSSSATSSATATATTSANTSASPPPKTSA
ncbi:nitric oxide synthase-like [Babylonia areolata]|uniref:nitric oxide synthase-like n=1 Tax=Babylonia areolata TaxID=304850 RepID=UPI003FD48621